MPDNQTKAKVTVQVVAENKNLLPFYATELSAGADLKACLKKKTVLAPGASVLVPTGLSIQLPAGYEAQIRPRSGMALKYQITVLNTPGTIDADYRGQVGVILINHGKKPFTIEPLMKIAQMVIAPVSKADFQIKEKLSLSSRGTGGFGSSGI